MSKDPVFPKCYVNVGDGAFIEAIPQPKDVIEKLEREIEELHSLLQKTGEHPNRQLTSAPELSAEQIEEWRSVLVPKAKGIREHHELTSLCRMALSSLTARDEGIEAVLNDEALHLSDRQRSRVRNLKGQP